MVFDATFNNISVISWRPVVLLEETRGPKEKPPTCRKSLTNLLFILASISSIPVKLYPNKLYQPILNKSSFMYKLKTFTSEIILKI